MTIFFASNSAAAFANPEGEAISNTSSGGRNGTFVSASIYMSSALLEAPMGGIKSEAWIHYDGSFALFANDSRPIAGYNSTAKRYDWYVYRTSTTLQIYYWNGSAFVTAGASYLFPEQDVTTVDAHYYAHSSAGVIEVYINEGLCLQATGLNTSGFQTDAIWFGTGVSSPVYHSQIIIADECTICWRLANRPLVNPVEGIRFVGSKFQALAGATSGTTNISLSSGLTGGIASAVAADDYVFAVFAVGSTADRTLSITDGTTGYTLLGTELYSNDNFDANLRVAYKKMGSTPDANTVFGATGATADAGVIGVYVIRGLDLTTVLDVAVVTTTQQNSSTTDPPSVTPITPLAWTLHVGAGAHDGTLTSYTNVPALLDFLQQAGSGTNSILMWIGHTVDWASGAVNPAALTGNVSVNTSATGTMSIALRPAAVAQTFSDMAGTVAGIAVASDKQADSFVASATVDQIVRGSGFSFTPPSIAYQVKGVGVNARVRRGDTGPQSANLLIRSNKTDGHKSDVSISPAFDQLNGVFETDPSTSAAWTVDNANKALVGVRSRT